MHLSFDIEKVKQGDKKQFKLFFEIFYPKLKALACRFVDEYTAEDIVQETFILYWKDKQIIDAINIQSYLYKCIQNRCLNFIKHQSIVDGYESKLAISRERSAFIENNTDLNDVFTQIANDDLKRIIDEAVEKLSPKCAQAFRLCYYHELTHKEVADLMGISPRTVSEYIYKTLAQLRKSLKYNI